MDELRSEPEKLAKLDSDTTQSYEAPSSGITTPPPPPAPSLPMAPQAVSPTSISLLSSVSPSSSPSLSKFNQLNGNKITLVPLSSSSGGSVMPIKRVVHVSGAPNSSFLSSSPSRNTTVLTSGGATGLAEKSAISNKIFASIHTATNANANASHTTNSNEVANSNKIQYVKIVNLNSSNSNSNSGSSPTTSLTSSTGNFKITTISAANNGGANSQVESSCFFVMHLN